MVKYLATPKNVKLNTKLNLICLSVFLGGIIAFNLGMNFWLFPQTENKLESKALLAIEAMNAVRNYTSTQIEPELGERLKTEIAFLPETVPAYSAREVFARLKANPEYKDFNYKEATLNPTNLKDKADEFETNLIEEFRQNEDREQISGFRQLERQSYYYLARPIKVTKASCLECHGKTEDAPRSLLSTYGNRGLGWNLNEIVGSQVLRLPTTKTIQATQRIKLSLNLVFVPLLIGILFVFYCFIKFSLLLPIQNMVVVAKKMGNGGKNEGFPRGSNDELGNLSNSLNRMIAGFHATLQKAKKKNPTSGHNAPP